MLKKLISGVVMVAGVIAMAMPAHAAPVVRHADFGSNGSVRIAYVNHRWEGRAKIFGLSNGTYEVFMNSWLDENHDGARRRRIPRGLHAEGHHVEARGAVQGRLQGPTRRGAWPGSAG